MRLLPRLPARPCGSYFADSDFKRDPHGLGLPRQMSFVYGVEAVISH